MDAFKRPLNITQLHTFESIIKSKYYSIIYLSRYIKQKDQPASNRKTIAVLGTKTSMTRHKQYFITDSLAQKSSEDIVKDNKI